MTTTKSVVFSTTAFTPVKVDHPKAKRLWRDIIIIETLDVPTMMLSFDWIKKDALSSQHHSRYCAPVNKVVFGGQQQHQGRETERERETKKGFRREKRLLLR